MSDIPIVKRCSKCGEEKPLSEFPKSKPGYLGTRPECKKCKAFYDKIYHSDPTNKDRANELRRAPERQKKMKEQQQKYRSRDDVKVHIKIRQQKYGQIYYSEDSKREQRKEYSKEYRKTHKKEFLEKSLNQYGITLDEYNKKVKEQNGLCLICHEEEKIIDKRTGKTKRLCVDHDHVTGKVRGLLCNKCNQAIGLIGDSPLLANAIADYLIEHDARGILWKDLSVYVKRNSNLD